MPCSALTGRVHGRQIPARPDGGYSGSLAVYEVREYGCTCTSFRITARVRSAGYRLMVRTQEHGHDDAVLDHIQGEGTAAVGGVTGLSANRLAAEVGVPPRRSPVDRSGYTRGVTPPRGGRPYTGIAVHGRANARRPAGSHRRRQGEGGVSTARHHAADALPLEKAYIAGEIQHIWSLMRGSAREVIEHGDVVAVGNATGKIRALGEHCFAGKRLVDLARLFSRKPAAV